MKEKYLNYALDKLEEIIKIPSPDGFTSEVTKYLKNEISALGYTPVVTNKGGVFVSIGGEDDKNALVLAAHVDTLGGMVHTIKDNGNLKITPIGALSPNNVETENVTIHTRGGKTYTGTYQLVNPSWHVNLSYDDTLRSFDNMEVVIDEIVNSKKDTCELGIDTGDIVSFEPRFVLTPSGFIKSRFLDDKLSSAILLAFAKEVKEDNIKLNRRIYLYFTVFEEVGHGAGGRLPEGVTEMISVDMGCVGEGLSCKETQVSICAKDSQGPSSYDVVTGLVNVAKKHDIDYAIDIYPRYISDADLAVKVNNIRHCVVGSGVFASHGYERTHINGVRNTYSLVSKYACLEK